MTPGTASQSPLPEPSSRRYAQCISWRACDRFMQKYVKHDGQERLTKVPADLDSKWYREEHDLDLLRRMMAAIEKGHVPSARRKLAIRRAVQKMMHDVATRDISQAVPVGGSFVGAPGDCLGMTVQARRRKETSP